MSKYVYVLRYQHTAVGGGKKVKERQCEVTIPLEKWTSALYSSLEKWLSSKEGGGDITIIEAKRSDND